MTNLTPAQLEQFETTFRYFDKDESNTLSQTEMTAALASLGIVYSVRIAVLRLENPRLTVEIGRRHGPHLRTALGGLRRSNIRGVHQPLGMSLSFS